ncbi:hypothetical protein GPECTOR_1g708 [Gonium pectorale]|uniref:aminodeoxychorismate synthase n=1 Tax=Gonium pectorale TaxID=33097 RepID=A0A150H3S9_GONPE|nr:hypothetical protein GPECTOR_1g708 [Gonium pectorale]|eukprot:KXZ56786.1 hypothetical protein GPECTOR_1g708 [Gonium pectorale]
MPRLPTPLCAPGVCLDVLQHLPHVPVLGICLGHQALALAHGAAVVRAPEPVHGRLSRLRHSGHALFREVPSGPGFDVVRYHSLLVDERSLPDCLEPICWTDGGHTAVTLARDQGPEAAPGTDVHRAAASAPLAAAASGNGRGLLMGLAHRNRPHYGVQFHPESVATRYGIALMRNFRDLAAQHWRARAEAGAGPQLEPQLRPVADIIGPPGRLPSVPAWPSAQHQRGAPLRLAWRPLRGLLTRLPGGSQGIFELLYGWAQDTFWLDSAAADRGRFSYMGGRGGPLWRKLTYRLPLPPAAAAATAGPTGAAHQTATSPESPGCAHAGPSARATDASAPSHAQPIGRCDGPVNPRPAPGTLGGDPRPGLPPGSRSDAASHSGPHLQPLPASACGGMLHTEAADGTTSVTRTPLGLLDHLQSLLASQRLLVEPEAARELPFNMWGGLVGYLGYELKAECGAAHAHAAATPDAVLFLADRLVAVDHREGDVFLLAMYRGVDAGAEGEEAEGVGREGQEAMARTWLAETERALEQAAAEAAGRPAAGVGQDQYGCSPAKRPCAGDERCQPAHLASSVPGANSLKASGLVANGHLPSCAPEDSEPALQPEAATPLSAPGSASPCCTASAHESPPCQPATGTATAGAFTSGVVPFSLAHPRAAYLSNIAACQEALAAGESYEVCLTTALTRPAAPDPPALYRMLRSLNPAPYAAWLQCGPSGPTICCSSPERFLRGDRGGLLEARPIKGTAARVPADPAADFAAAAELARSEKERAENLMIVDLLRNDLGRVCEVRVAGQG